MPSTDIDTPQTKIRSSLVAALLKRNKTSALALAYYRATYPPIQTEPRHRAAYRLLLEEARSPWAQLVVDAITERLTITGLVTGDDPTDIALWNTIQDSHLDADQRLIYTDALITGYGYVSIWPSTAGAKLAVESTFEVITAGSAAQHRTPTAALKLWRDGKAVHTTLYTNDAVYRSSTEVEPDAPLDADELSKRSWTQTADPEQNPIGTVPIIAFRNRRDTFGHGHGEIEPLRMTLRRIDRLVLAKLLTAETASFRQKWSTGLSVPKDPKTNEPIEPFNAALDKLWVTEDKDAKFGTFESTDLEPYMLAIEQEIAHLAAISRVPAHYLMQQNLVNPPSAESLLAAEAGLIAKATDKQDTFGEAWEHIGRLIMTIDNTADTDAPRPELARLEVKWRDAGRKSPAQIADAVVKLKEVGVPQEALWEMIEATPSQIRKWRALAATERYNASIAQPPVRIPTPEPAAPDQA